MDTNAEPPVRVDISDTIAKLTLNRPAQRNALHPDLISALSEALKALSLRDDIHVVVIGGAGKAFCAGLDLDHLRRLDLDARVRYMRSAFALFEQLSELPQPTIAAVNGPAVAGGFDLAVFCDLRVASSTARFAQPEVLLGATQFIYPLCMLIGVGRAREMALTGQAITAEEGYRIGLVNVLAEPQQLTATVSTLARTIAARPPQATRASKRLGQQVPGMDRATALAAIGEALDDSLRSEEHRQTLEAFLRNRLDAGKGG